MAVFTNRVVGRPKTSSQSPFGIAQSGQSFYVTSGKCYSTFTYGYDSLIPVENLYQPIALPPNDLKDYCFYLDFTILPNLQVSGASVKVTKVGRTAPEGGWADYPDMYSIRPFDIKNDKGQVTQIVDGKKQQKCYLLLGRIHEDKPDLDPYPSIAVTGMSSNNTPKNYFLTKYTNSDIIMMYSQVSGVPVVFPMSYFGSPYYKMPEEYPAT
jgi:hypothetical protein